jgi:autotransporter-associated beta strand protein
MTTGQERVIIIAILPWSSCERVERFNSNTLRFYDKMPPIRDELITTRGCRVQKYSAPLRSIPLATMLMLVASCAFADSYWQGGTSDFNVAGSWNPSGVPTGVNAINDSGSNNVVLVQPGDSVWSPWDIRAGDGASASGSYLQTGSTNDVNGWFRLGDSANSTGYYTLSNGVVNVSLQAHVGEIGQGVLTISGGTFNVGQIPFCVGDGDFGAGGAGTLNLNGGTINTPPGVDLWLGEGYNGGAGGTGKMVMTGGTVNIGGWLAIGRFGGIGDLELSGGRITMSPGNTGNITLATTPSTGVVNQSGGALTNTVSQTWIAESANGTWNLNGGTDVLGIVLLTRLSGATGTFNLNGGDLFATQITDPGGNGAFNFNGGTLHALSNSANFLQANRGATVKSGGVNINTEGCNITINQPFANGGGGLTKLGTGSLTLSGNLSYSGPTVVSNGNLTICVPDTFASSGCTVSGGATLSLLIVEANAQLSVPTLTIGATGGGLNFNLAGSGSQPAVPLHVNSLIVNGPVTINVAGYNFSPGEIPLMQYGSHTGNGSFTLGSLPIGMTAQLVTNTANSSIDLVIATAPTGGMPWQPMQAPVMTDWAQQVNPTNVLPEYPRPQMVRSNWMNLNGVWQFQAAATNDPVPAGLNLANVILVPFPMESALSGVMQYYPFSWYRQQFTVPAGWAGQRILLHFQAVNWQSQVYINGQSMGIHTGGYDPFTYDITPYLNGGTNELIVRVYSPEDNGGEPRGKQTLYPAGIMFTSSSGIWQPVWLEPVPTTSIGNIQLTPDIDNNRLLVNAGINGSTNGVRVNGYAYAGSNLVASTTVLPGQNLYLNIPSPTLWSPTNPYLYNLQVTLTSNAVPLDSITSYFGMRKISLGTNNGFVKILLNNQPLFEFGPLDQGYWPDGIYTAPTDSALQYDLRMEKTLGFNMVRKHLKVEPERWYYWADQLGILVWQDMPSCNSYTSNPNPPAVNPLDYIAELKAMVTNHWNSPAIIMWDIFNEGQGQAEYNNTGNGQTNTPYLVSLVQNLDPSRLVNQASGWVWVGAGNVEDTHNYPNPECSLSSSQAVTCGEFGGVLLGVEGHTWSPANTDVPVSQVATTVTPQIESLVEEVPGLIESNGMSAAVYTEISDVEIELAGLQTCDRKILKPSLSAMQTTIASLTGASHPANILPTPILAPVSNITITADQTLLVTNIATDPAVPGQTLTWSFGLSYPAGATINATNGLVSWRPTISQSPSTNLFTVVVTDSSVPPTQASQSFSVVVLQPSTPTFSSATITAGMFQSMVGGNPGPDYSIYTTTNLSSDWQLLLVTNPVALPFLFTDPASTNYQQRFYRVQLGP